MLVLPPSFPFGGMENPRHDLRHADRDRRRQSPGVAGRARAGALWSGNLVTNASWKHIWLNEGFTTYVQGRITEALYGDELAEMERQIDQEELAREISRARSPRPTRCWRCRR